MKKRINKNQAPGIQKDFFVAPSCNYVNLENQPALICRFVNTNKP